MQSVIISCWNLDTFIASFIEHLHMEGISFPLSLTKVTCIAIVTKNSTITRGQRNIYETSEMLFVTFPLLKLNCAINRVENLPFPGENPLFVCKEEICYRNRERTPGTWVKLKQDRVSIVTTNCNAYYFAIVRNWVSNHQS